MIQVSESFMQAVRADTRQFSAKVKMYFDGDDAEPLILEDDEIVDFSVLEESRTDSRDPVGSVTSNECTISLRNDDYRFTPSNAEGPLYGKLIPNVKFEIFAVLHMGDLLEEILLGTFRTGDWDVNSDALSATVVGTDIIAELSAKPVKDVPPESNISIKDLFRKIFSGMGLTTDDYIIDESIVGQLVIGWVPGGSFNDVMSKLSVAGNCSIMASRDNKVLVKNNSIESDPVDTFTDDDMILDASNPQHILNAYTGVKVNYYTPKLLTDVSLYSITDVMLGPLETLTLYDVTFNEEPIAHIKRIVASNLGNVTITLNDIGARSATIELVNKGDKEEKISFEIIGDRYQLNKLSYTLYDEDAKHKWGDRLYEVDNVYIQSLPEAANHAKMLLEVVADPFIDFSVTSRGNPAIEIFDVVTIDAPSCNINNDIIVIRSEMSYDGALSINMQGRKYGVVSGGQ